MTLNNNILPMPWTGPGSGNAVLDPLLKHIPQVSETHFTSWEQAQVLRDWFSLQPGSPARGTGPNGLDKGGAIPRGASISGTPRDVTSLTTATFVVGVNCTGSGIPATGFPLGSGFTHYRWRLDGTAWSEETPIASPLELAGLAAGSHYVEVIGKNDAGWYQNDPALGEDAAVTMSRAWTVDPSYLRLVINEVLAVNHSQEHEGTRPGMVELYYDGATSLDLSDMYLTNSAATGAKFVFPAGSAIEPGQYLVLYADANATASGIHLGFALSGEEDGLHLYNRLGALVDSIEFGRQLADLSIGRLGYEDVWRLTVPTLGRTNLVQPLGDPGAVRINEWLARAQDVSVGSFIELYNPDAGPVDFGGTYLTDGPAARPAGNRARRLSFMAAHGYLVFQADNSDSAGHVDFRLSAAGGTIRLLDFESKEIDRVVYGSQATDVSEGRTPDGAGEIEYFPTPTPGSANPGAEETATTDLTLVPEWADKRVLVPTAAVGDDWKDGSSFDDAAWTSCAGAPGGVGYEKGTGYQSLITLDLQAQMYGSGKSNTCCIRVPFTVDASALADVNDLILKVRYDDGFVAYLNGKEVARRNFTGTPAWNSHADSAAESNVQDADEYIDLSVFLGDLKAGANLLAIHGMNASNTSSDFLITVGLEATVVKAQSQ